MSAGATTSSVCPTSGRLTNASAARSQTARPSRLAKTFFSLSPKRDDLPAAGRMTAKRDMVATPGGRGACATPLARSYRPLSPVRQPVSGRGQLGQPALEGLTGLRQEGV